MLDPAHHERLSFGVGQGSDLCEQLLELQTALGFGDRSRIRGGQNAPPQQSASPRGAPLRPAEVQRDASKPDCKSGVTAIARQQLERANEGVLNEVVDARIRTRIQPDDAVDCCNVPFVEPTQGTFFTLEAPRCEL